MLPIKERLPRNKPLGTNGPVRLTIKGYQEQEIQLWPYLLYHNGHSILR